MPDVNPEIILAIEWGIVPLILIGILAYFLTYTPEKSPSNKIKNSSSAGKLAGLIIFALILLSQKHRALLFSFDMPAYDFNILIVLIAVAVGFIFSWFFNLIKTKVYIGLYTLVSVTTVSTAIFCYLFIQNLRSNIVFVTMGMMIGILIYAIFFPGGIKREEKASQP